MRPGAAAKLAAVPGSAEPVPIAGEPRPRIAPGERLAVCVGARIERHKVFARWTAILRFAVVNETGERLELPAYLNLGCGDAPNPTPTGRFYQAWCVAADRKPARGERMDPAVFRERQFRVEVADVGSGAGAYSKICKILERIA